MYSQTKTMHASLAVLVLGLAAVTAHPKSSGNRIVGGSLTTIEQYPFQVALLESEDLLWYSQFCGGTILNSRSILTAGHCTFFATPNHFRVRVGSTFANSGGVVHNVAQLILHPEFNIGTFLNNDVTIVRLASTITFNNQARAAPIAGSNYNVADNQVVWASGWGDQWFEGPASEQLRHVQVWTINQDICRNRYYEELELTVNENMLCSGWLDVGGRDQCQGDSGGPLVHNGVLVGVTSWGHECAHPHFPGINVRVSRYTTWIQANA